MDLKVRPSFIRICSGMSLSSIDKNQLTRAFSSSRKPDAFSGVSNLQKTLERRQNMYQQVEKWIPILEVTPPDFSTFFHDLLYQAPRAVTYVSRTSYF